MEKKCYHSIDTREYYKQKYGWLNKELDIIWWKPLEIALKKQNYTDRLAVQKFIHDFSRTKYREHMYYDYIPQTCPICTTTIENEDHILKCLVSTCHQLRQQWIAELTKHLTTYCPTIIKDLIIQHIHHWLEPTIHQTTFQDVPECLKKGLTEQGKLGWDHFIKGRITDIWGPVLTQLRNNPIYKIKSKIDITTWATRIIKINFKFILIILRLRCDQVNGTSNIDKETSKKAKLILEIMEIQQVVKHMELHPQDYKFFYENIETFQRQHSSQLQT